ncbi:hypothetical protein HDU76_001345 [Blyttiomyces sp. JEL0837]|nr:hypothetical protein HDU76_001345 [Blyttiomyces sp. JEL0837]
MEVCQATLLLSVVDYGARKGARSWMYTGMGCRLAMKLDVPFTKTVNDFYSLFNGQPKPVLASGLDERKRVWWAAIIIDTFVTFSTGVNFLINESDYIDTIMDVGTLIPAEGQSSSPNMTPQGENLNSRQKWLDFLRLPATNSLFEPMFQSPGRPNEEVFDMSKLSDTMYLVQLCFFARKVFRFGKFSKSSVKSSQMSVNSTCLLSLVSNPNDIHRLHDNMIIWYELLPPPFRLIKFLEPFAGTQVADVSDLCTVTSSRGIPSICVTLNLMFFATLVLLHHGNLKMTGPLESAGAAAVATHPGATFRVSSNPLSSMNLSSLDVCQMAYRAQCLILRLVYDHRAPSPSRPPPPIIVASPMIHCFLLPAPTALLSQFHTGAQITRSAGPGNSVAAVSGGGVLEPLSSIVLPVLDNVAQVWPTSSNYAANLRAQSQVFKDRWRDLLAFLK